MEPIHLRTQVHPGPIDDSVLKLQQHHRSSLIWQGDEGATFTPLVVRRCDSAFWSAYARAPPRVKDIIDEAGFGGISRVGDIMLDHALVTALVERWRQETHTFHFPVGEATITLQDVALLFGLQVDGDPIIGDKYARPRPQWQDLCHRLLGFRPEDNEVDGNRLMKGALERQLLAPLAADAPYDVYAQRARTFILLLLGGHLFSDKSGRFIALRYLLHLDDIKRSGTLSWGSAVLAYLYRSMCEASQCKAREICGPLVLLQIWAWERLPVLRPIPKPMAQLPKLAPLGARWHVAFDLHRLPTNVLITYRSQLDALHGDQFRWIPFPDDYVKALDPRYLHGSDIWQSVVPLICWEIIELHLPDRVMRQFGLEQLIPADCDTSVTLHSIKSGGSKLWESYHSSYIDAWRNSRTRVCQGAPTPNACIARQDYKRWFDRITRLVVGNPEIGADPSQGYQATGSSVVMLASAVSRMVSMASERIDLAAGEDRDTLSHIRDIGNAVLTAVGASVPIHDMSRSSDTSTAVLQTAARGLAATVPGRLHPGVRRGGKRPLVDRDLGIFDSDANPEELLDQPVRPPVLTEMDPHAKLHLPKHNYDTSAPELNLADDHGNDALAPEVHLADHHDDTPAPDVHLSHQPAVPKPGLHPTLPPDSSNTAVDLEIIEVPHPKQDDNQIDVTVDVSPSVIVPSDATDDSPLGHGCVTQLIQDDKPSQRLRGPFSGHTFQRATRRCVRSRHVPS